jgi:site-specific recombinase XerD
MDTCRRRSPATMPGYGRGRKPGNAGHTYPPEVLRPGEAAALVREAATAARDPVIGQRNRALFTILYRAGLRLAEALALRPVDIEPEYAAVNVLRGKGGKRRTVGLDPAALAIVTDWMSLRRERWGLDGTGPLFCTPAGRSLHQSYVRDLMRRLARRVGIERRVHPHMLRHTLAAELAKEGVPMPLIQRQLGHASLATTDRYLRTIAPEEVLHAMQQRSWNPDA